MPAFILTTKLRNFSEVIDWENKRVPESNSVSTAHKFKEKRILFVLVQIIIP